jgi:hypothetical protein
MMMACQETNFCHCETMTRFVRYAAHKQYPGRQFRQYTDASRPALTRAIRFKPSTLSRLHMCAAYPQLLFVFRLEVGWFRFHPLTFSAATLQSYWEQHVLFRRSIFISPPPAHTTSHHTHPPLSFLSPRASFFSSTIAFLLADSQCLLKRLDLSPSFLTSPDNSPCNLSFLLHHLLF